MGKLENRLHEHCRDLLESDEKRELTAFCPSCGQVVPAFSTQCPHCRASLTGDEDGAGRRSDVPSLSLGSALAEVCLVLAQSAAALLAVGYLYAAANGFWSEVWTDGFPPLLKALVTAGLFVGFWRLRRLAPFFE